MPNFKVINPDNPEEIDLVQDIPLVDEETGSDQIDSEGNILVKRYVTRTVSLNGINAVKDSLPQIKENTKNLKDLHDYSHSVNTDQQDQILENSSKITELLTDTTALEVTVTEIESKLKGIQGIDIDEVKSDLDALQQSAYLITGGTLKGDISVQTPNTATITLTPSGLSSSASFACNTDALECTTTWGKLFKQSEEGGFFYGLSSTALADKNGKELTNYISDIMGSNAQLTFIKGDGTSQVISINNVLKATKATNADNLGGYPASDFIRSVNGANADTNGNVTIQDINAVNLTGNQTISGIKTFTNTTKMNAVSVSGPICRETTDKYLLLQNGTGETGAYAIFYGSDYTTYQGYFSIGARTDSGTIVQLVGRPNGSLTWNNKELSTKEYVDNRLLPVMNGSITLNGTTNNTVVLTDIVTRLSLEVGDVIRINTGSYNKLHTVESITNNGSIIVNYEHAGNRGNGSLKLPNTSGQATVTRIAKWFNAPLGLGQAWVDMMGSRVESTNYTNTTGRPFMVAIYSRNGGWRATSNVYIDGILVAQSKIADSDAIEQAITPSTATLIIPRGSTVSCNLFTSWFELR